MWWQQAGVWFLYAECNFHLQYDFDTHDCDYDTQDCDFNTHKSDFYAQSMILTRMSVIITLTSVITTRTSWIPTRCVWLWHKPTKITVRLPIGSWLAAIPQYHTHNRDFYIMPVMLAPWEWFWHSACDFNNHVCDFPTHTCRINTLRGIVTVSYCVSLEHAYVKIQYACACWFDTNECE
jgi:hypothetical protein